MRLSPWKHPETGKIRIYINDFDTAGLKIWIAKSDNFEDRDWDFYHSGYPEFIHSLNHPEMTSWDGVAEDVVKEFKLEGKSFDDIIKLAKGA